MSYPQKSSKMQALIPAAEMQPKQMPPNKFPGAAHATVALLLTEGGWEQKQ